MQFQLAPAAIETWILAFARVGALVLTLPGLGERALPARMRIVVAMAVALAAMPEVGEKRGEGIVLLLLRELLVGLSLGLCVRLSIGAMETAGSLIAQSIGLSFAQSIDPSQGQQGEVLATFFRMLGVALIFAADLHHVMIAGVIGSYNALPPGAILPPGDLATLAIRLLRIVFEAGIAIAAPFIAFGFIFNLGLGFASRMAPQVQLFFLAMPVSIILGGAALAVTLGGTRERFLMMVSDIIATVLPGG